MKINFLLKQNLKWIVPMIFLLISQQNVHAQNTIVRGTVMDEAGETLPGVNVLLKGTTIGVTTDIEGQYSLNVPQGDGVLVFSFVGYSPYEIAIGNQSVINVNMAQDTRHLQEVVVIGYGTQNRETVTGSISTVKSEDFNPGVIADPMTLITGKVAGLTITRPNGGDPNAVADFSLRGVVSLEGSSQPLIVIDGVPGGDLRTIAPQDIESIDVLKDGSAAAIYGSRATGGVILVTTKRGQEGPTRVSYSGYTSTDRIARRYEMLDGPQYRQFRETHGGSINDQGANTDWFDELLRDNPISHGHNLNFSGGSGKTDYFASINYQNFQGIDLVSSRRFVNGSLRINTKALNDKLNFSLGVTNSFDNKSFAEYHGFGQALNMNPTWPVYGEDGNFFERPELAQGQLWNPVANAMLNTNDSRERRLLATTNVDYAFMPSLIGRVSYSFTMQDFTSGAYTDNRLQYQQISGILGQASRSQNSTINNILETTLDYNKQIDNHTFNVLGGYSYQNIFNEGFGAGNNTFNTNSFLYNNLGAGSAINNLNPQAPRAGVFVNSFANERTLVAYFGRVIYDYMDRYLLNVSVRREGASVLGADNKWGTFYGVSGGWIVSKENFMQGVGFINNLKVRAGYGITGNQEGLSPYMSLAKMGPMTRWSPPDWQGRPGQGYWGTPTSGDWRMVYAPTDNPNPALRWEIKKELNVGFDFGLFEDNWLSGSLDIYDRTIEDLIGNFTAQKPAHIHDLIQANAGTMKNHGVELMLDAQLVRKNNFNWNATFVGAQNINQITAVSNDQFQGTAHDITEITWLVPIQRLAPGQPVSVFYGRVFSRFDEDGQWLFLNNEGEEVRFNEIGDNDFQYLGNSIPRYNLGLTNTFRFGRFDGSVLLRSALGFNVVNAKRIYHGNVNSRNLFASAAENPVMGEMVFSSYFIEKGDYLKVDNVTLGYTFPFYNLRVYATALNLAVLSGFSGMDPELGVNPYTGAGVEFRESYYPRTRTFTVGISAQF
jgi:TonB-linked SusC/RagA family outer membrane protein